VHLDPAANEIGDNVRLEVGERQDEIWLQREDLSMFADVKALTRGFSRRACGGRTT
jgi:hypothetical protein